MSSSRGSVNVEMDRRTASVHDRQARRRPTTCCHIRYKSTTSDARGHGPLEAGRTRLVAAGVLSRYARTSSPRGGVPYYVIKHPDELDRRAGRRPAATQWVDVADVVDRAAGGAVRRDRDRAVADVTGGHGARSSWPSYNESRIAVLLGVPPFLVGLPSGGDSMTYSNVDVAVRLPLARRAPAEGRTRSMPALSDWALPRGTDVEVNRDDYVRRRPAASVRRRGRS